MAVRIRIRQNRAEVSPDFLDFYRQIAEFKLRREMDKIKSFGRDQAKRYMQQRPAMFGRLAAIAQDVREAGKGMDYELTRLHSLEYERLDIVKYQGRVYFMGQTHSPLMMDEMGRDSGVIGKWQSCAYQIYVPYKCLVDASTNDIHMIPVKDPWNVYRHPHHKADTSVPHNELSFLEMPARTCWSEFGSPMMTVIGEVDLPEIFRFLRTFVGRYYPGSPLANPLTGQMKFMEKVK